MLLLHANQMQPGWKGKAIMGNGIGALVTDQLLYFLLFWCGAIGIISTIFLAAKGKVINKPAKRWITALIILVSSIALGLIGLALAFGNNHPSASPCRFSESDVDICLPATGKIPTQVQKLV